MKAYITTKDECKRQIKKRMPIVCSGCGNKVQPIKTVDNSGDPTYWMGCMKCMCFDNGVSPRVFEIATKMVDIRNYRAYSYDTMPDKEKKPEMFDYWRTSQIRGTTRIVIDILNFDLTS